MGSFPPNHKVGALKLVKNPLMVNPVKAMLDLNRDGANKGNKSITVEKASLNVAKYLDDGAYKKLLPLCTPPTFNPPIKNGSPMRELQIQLKTMWSNLSKIDDFDVRYKKFLMGYIKKQKMFTGLPNSAESLYKICFGNN